MTDPSHHRAVFLDFDGTFADHGVVPHAHAEAVRAARANGHHVLVCTGRPLSIVEPAVRQLFDGVVTSAGARVDIDGQTLCDVRIPQPIARHTVEVLERHGAAYCLEAPDAMWAPQRSIDLLRERMAMMLDAGDPAEASGAQTILDALAVPDHLLTCSYAKVSVWDSPVGILQLAQEAGDELRALPNSITGDAARSGELQNARVDKADGVAVVARHLGLAVENTVGAGDGMNDVGMLEAVGTAIGIEGSPEEVLAHADLVVPGPGGLGLVAAFEQLGLI
ncbi:HAD family hydrolase [Mariniluteicoccus endophyticus]